jgi:hypothetical protein
MKEIEYVTGETWGNENQMDDETYVIDKILNASQGNVNLNTFDDTRNAST